MKAYLIISLLAVSCLSSCKKDCTPDIKDRHMPVAVIKVNGKLTEISKTTGTTPSVVLVGGFGSELGTWKQLYSALDPNITVFAYNRAGIGGSDNIPGPRDAKTIATEMKTILDANNIHPPYIFVAHSMGGIYARMFYHLNPGKVKGMVLVDATHENQLDSLLGMIPQPERDIAIAEMNAANDSILQTMPAGSLKEEFRANFETNYRQIKEYPTIVNIPMYVITSTKITPDNPALVAEVHRALHQQWAISAGVNGNFVTTNKSGHYIHVEEPFSVAEGIRWVLSK